MAGGGQERRSRRRPGEDGVDRPGGRVDEGFDLAEEGGSGHSKIGRGELDRREHAGNRVIGTGRSLVEPELGTIGDDQVGERAADIASQSQHLSPAGHACNTGASRCIGPEAVGFGKAGRCATLVLRSPSPPRGRAGERGPRLPLSRSRRDVGHMLRVGFTLSY